ncbi:glycine/betaine ABC transporter permease [Streptomyces abyssalis]|uniref:Glycine/betaine ABC transporter permease n=1 Tax=Streptomyces abyssalis TaxID=933944 RepID=A0A1E7JFU0_9ACTN|nr:ABC transporter permease subunit [Streptomyces abyssalis]OEU85333.1 glycine/betaine ABC transporter permease [Streptomyces abyssalis]OEU91496.1 glycine/betaine ABC transporter permease [Streptomyces abyssalis]OEV06086.1 glycine/betaine ABC transporter permease [Streptomyces nanshensis]
MSTPTIPEQGEQKTSDAPSPRQPDGRPEQQAPPSGLAVLARSPKVLAVLVAVLVVVVSAAVGGSGVWPQGWTIDIRTPLNDLDGWLVDNREKSPIFLYFLLHISNSAESSVDAIISLFDAMGWIGVTVVGTLVGWAAGGSDLSRRALRTGGTTLGVFIACGVLNMWAPTMETLALMTVAVFAAAVLGLLLGLGAGLSDRFEKILRPVFDTMQVMPAFAYLLPLLLMFGVGVPSALIATVIYAAPPMARLTSLGLRSADPAALEASASLGASHWQRLWTARLPLARKQMMLGLNQAIMMCLSMVVLASLIGSEGLGDEIYQALGSLDVGTALTAGVAVVLIAVLLDRTTAAAGERLDATVTVGATRLMARIRMAVWGLVLALIGVFSAVGSSIGEREWPDVWTVDVTRPLQSAVDWLTETIGSGIPVLGGTVVWAKGFTVYVLNPLRSGLETTPWWALALLVGVIGWIVGTWRAALTGVICLGLIGMMGLWEKSMDTFSQVIGGLVLTMVIGIVLGILTARVERVERMLRPVLDTMQTMPQFVYLIPVIALVGLSRSAGIIAAVIYACPAVIRITAQGLRYVDPAAMEASRSLGATSRQQLLGVQLPLARKSLLVGVNQGVVLVLSMVVIAGLIGGGALGYDVVQGLSKGDLSQGLPAGIAIVCLGIMLDRITQPAGERPRD